MNNYALNTPIKRGVFVPPAEKPVMNAPHTSNQMQNRFEWLQHKPQNHAIFPEPAKSGRDKK